MEVLHEDYLERSVYLSETKREIKKGYFVFRQNNAGSKMLEYYKDSNWRKQEPKGIFNLINGYSIDAFNDVKKRYGMLLKTIDKTVELFTASEDARSKWLHVLNDDVKGSFSATLVEYPSGAQHVVPDLKQVHLQITDSCLIMLSNRIPLITWRFSTIRKYKALNGAFVLEVGRKAPTGEGVFRFRVLDPCKVFDELDKALKMRIKLKLNHEVPSLPAVESSTLNRRSLTNSPSRISTRETRSFSDYPVDYSSVDSIPAKTAMMENMKRGSFDSPTAMTENIKRGSFDSPSPSPFPPEYSSLNHIPPKAPLVKQESSGYDKLFGDRFSWPNLSQQIPPPISNSTKRLRPQSLRQNSVEAGGENYIDMSGLKHELVKECRNNDLYDKKVVRTRPIPMPRPQTSRSNSTDPIPMPRPQTSRSNSTDLEDNRPPSSDIDLIDFNTYDCPSTTAAPQQSEASKGYHFLNKLTPPKVVPSDPGYDPGYDHLRANQMLTNGVVTEKVDINHNTISQQNELYDSPKLYANSDYDHHEKHPLPKPVRPPPPLRRPRTGSGPRSSGEGSPKLVQMMEQKLDLHPAGLRANESVYDCPRGVTGNTNPFVGTDKCRNDIYKIPRGDA